MKSLAALTVLLLSTLAASASITINLNAGQFTLSNGSTPIPFGSLLQIIVSTQDNVFTTPTPASFTGGSADDFVLASFSSNNIPGGANSGSTQNGITFNLSDFANLTSGDQIMLRWWPTLTTASSTPGAGTSFGQFRTDAVENGSGIAWVVPPDGSTNLLQFITSTFGGSEPNSAGVANLLTTAIPEPSTLASLLVGGGVLFLAGRRRSKV